MKYITIQQKMLAILLVFALGGGTMQAAVEIKHVHTKIEDVFYNFFDYQDGQSWSHHMTEIDTLIHLVKKAHCDTKNNKFKDIASSLSTLKRQVEEAKSNQPVSLVLGGKILLTLHQLKGHVPTLQSNLEAKFKKEPKYGSFDASKYFSERLQR